VVRLALARLYRESDREWRSVSHDRRRGVTAPASAELRFMVLRAEELVAAPDPVTTGELVGVDLVGHTSDGRFVGGLVAAWTLSAQADSFIISDDELVFTIDAAGTAQITATAGALVRTQAITAAD
jgi:hypothetical protein